MDDITRQKIASLQQKVNDLQQDMRTAQRSIGLLTEVCQELVATVRVLHDQIRYTGDE